MAAMRLENKTGSLQVDVLPFGATLQRVIHHGVDLILGFDSEDGYRQRAANPSIGCVVGRVAGRIAQAQFLGPEQPSGKQVMLLANHGEHTLHGGPDGLQWQTWRVAAATATSVTLTYCSPDGDQGFPGQLDVSVTYCVTDDDVVEMHEEARVDGKPCPVSLTNHSYWNLSGAGSGDILHCQASVEATQVVETDETLIPTRAVAASDTSSPAARLCCPAAEAPTLRDVVEPLIDTPYTGLDHSYPLPKPRQMRQAVRLVDCRAGRALCVWTDKPSVHVFTGGCLRGQVGKGGRSYPRFGGVAIETQYLPNQVNAVDPSAREAVFLHPGQVYQHCTRFHLSML